jgi:hypothetical protein
MEFEMIAPKWEAEQEKLEAKRAAFKASFSEEDKLDIFNRQSFLTKDQVLADIVIELRSIEDLMETASGEPLRYLTTKRDFLKKFINRIAGTVLFEKLEPWWSYQYRLSSRGAVLELVHAGSKRAVLPDGKIFAHPDTTLTVVEMLARTMTIEEYAKYSGKTEGSIRQALRRGKFRSAFKAGQEWRIPELCQPDFDRGYSKGMYEWETELADLPGGFEYLRAPTWIDISQDDADKKAFTIYVFNRDNDDSPFHHVDKTDMERLEHYLIANPFVIYREDEKVYQNRRENNGEE